MGPHKYNMAPRLLVLIALAAYCQALPAATDAVVPEGMMMQVAFSSMTPTAFISAMTKSGGSKADCGTFASTTVSDIGTAVSSQQTVLDALDNGRGCAALGQTLVTSTQAAVVSAQADVVTKQGLASDALAAKTAACSASVEFDVNLDALANSCYDYTSEASFTQAEAACDSATSASTAADADVVCANRCHRCSRHSCCCCRRSISARERLPLSFSQGADCRLDSSNNCACRTCRRLEASQPDSLRTRLGNYLMQLRCLPGSDKANSRHWCRKRRFTALYP